jgi:heme/copper-type cytochrome/quinol oxidase subunit 2
MRIDPIKQDLIFFTLLVAIIVGLPFGIRAYDRHLDLKEITNGAKEFTLTGNAQRGWLLGEVQANDILSFRQKNVPVEHPVIEVFKDDRVVLKLRSSDVTHGFSLKAFGVYLANGIKPGKTVFVSFKADRTGTFVFACNVYCGDIHQHMKGTLVVKDRPLSDPDKPQKKTNSKYNFLGTIKAN